MARVLTKKSTVAAKVPLATDLEIGELAVNTADAKLYTKHSDNTVKQLGIATNDSRLTDAREWTASTVTQVEAEAGTATTRRAWTAQRVFQAITAWWAASAMKTKLDGIATGATANSTDAQLRDRATHTGTQAISTVTGLQTALDGKISTTERGVSGGVATLDQFARIPASQLPSYVDDVLEYLTLSAFPATGETGKIYIAINQGTAANPTRQYRWTGSAYVEINPSPGTTDALAEGSTNLYFSESRVRNSVLTGLSLASSAAVAATDSVLAAFGKLQAQLGLKAPLASPALTGNPTAPTQAADGNDTSIATTAHVKAAMGLFGLGASNVESLPVGASLSDMQSTRLFQTADGSPPDFPVGLGLGRYPMGLHFQRSTAVRGQFALGFTGCAAYRVTDNSGTFSAWRKMYDTSNILGTGSIVQEALDAKQNISAVVTKAATAQTSLITDAGQYQRFTNTGASTYTIAPQSSVAWADNTELTIRRAAAANLTLVAGSGVTLNAPSGGTLVLTNNMTVTLKRVAANVWDVIGQTVAA